MQPYADLGAACLAVGSIFLEELIRLGGNPNHLLVFVNEDGVAGSKLQELAEAWMATCQPQPDRDWFDVEHDKMSLGMMGVTAREQNEQALRRERERGVPLSPREEAARDRFVEAHTAVMRAGGYLPIID